MGVSELGKAKRSDLIASEWLTRIRLGEDSGLELKRLVMRGDSKVDGPHPVVWLMKWLRWLMVTAVV
jgi:hypothetical protein